MYTADDAFVEPFTNPEYSNKVYLTILFHGIMESSILTLFKLSYALMEAATPIELVNYPDETWNTWCLSDPSGCNLSTEKYKLTL